MSEDNSFEQNQSKQNDYDYYKILGVSKSANIIDIKKRYRSLLAKFHPDKLKNLSKSESEEKAEHYLLIRTAGEILTNQEKKTFYDMETKVIFNKDFLKQKQSFEKFASLQDIENTDAKKSLARIEFQRNIDHTNLSKGYNSKLDTKLDLGMMHSQVMDLQAQRDTESIEFTKSNIFNEQTFNQEIFNKKFNHVKAKEEAQKKKQIERGEIMIYEDKFTAYNDVNTGNFISVNDDYGNLYSNDNFKDSTLFTKTYPNNNTNLSSTSSTSSTSDEDEQDEIIDIDNSSDDSGDDFEEKLFPQTKLTERDYEQILAERFAFEENISTMNINDYKSPLEDQFSISRDFNLH
jgi:curved DNA-binding protein CbpA